MKHKRQRFQNGSLTTEARKNGPDVWVFRWRERVDGKTVKRKVVLGTVNELSKTQVKIQADKYRHQANAATPAPLNSSLTVQELAEHYAENELDTSEKTAKVKKAYHYALDTYILPKWGKYSLAEVKAVKVEEWLKTIRRANTTKAKIREVFGAAFRHAMRHELYPTNPIANVRQSRKRATDPAILESSEIVSILRELEGIEPARTAFLIAATTGMRRGEVFGLKWQDVELESAVLRIRRSYVDGVEGPPKTESSRRPLPLPPQALEAVKAWKEQTPFSHAEDWVFASEITFGKHPLWPLTLWRRNVAPAIKRAGITKPKLGWHTLRRSYASLLMASGANLKVSMDLMRHSTAEMTLALYAQTVGNDKREASGKVAAMVLGEDRAA